MEDINVSRDKEWLGAWVGKELMMMSADQGLYLSLSESGGRIWELLEQPQTLEMLCQKLSQEYDISPDQVQQEVRCFVDKLAEERVIHVQSAAIA